MGAGNRTCTGTSKRYQLCRVQVSLRQPGPPPPSSFSGRSQGSFLVAPGPLDTLSWAWVVRAPGLRTPLPASNQICGAHRGLQAPEGKRTRFCWRSSNTTSRFGVYGRTRPLRSG